MLARLVQTLSQGPEKEASRLAAQILAYLSSDARFRAAMVRERAAPALVALLQGPGAAGKPVTKWVVHALCALSAHVECVEEMWRAGVVRPLLELIQVRQGMAGSPQPCGMGAAGGMFTCNGVGFSSGLWGQLCS